VVFAVPVAALALVIVVLMAALGVAVSQRRAAQQRARVREHGVLEVLAREAVFEHCGEAVVVLDGDGRIVHRNDAAEALMGPLGGDHPQRPLMRLPRLDDVAPSAPVDARHPLWVEGRHLDARLTALRDANGAAVGSVLWVREGPREDAGDARTLALSSSDEVMGIPNRRHFLELLRRELLRARRYGRPLALVGIRLEGFADIVHAHGAETADALLRAVAATVVADLRATDSLGRLRDDAVAVCLADVDAERAEAEAARLLEEIGQVEVHGTGAAIRAVASVVVVHAAREGAEALVAAVESMLARAGVGPPPWEPVGEGVGRLPTLA
jgi:diguanylate cyclase (GGDEF)-like protein